MASGTLGSLVVNIVARTEKFTQGIGKSLFSLGRLSRGISRTTKLLGAFGVALVGVGSVAGFGAMIKGQLDAIDSMAKLSDTLKISTESLAALNLAAEEAGVSSATLGKNMTKMVKNISEASIGRGVLKELQEIGLSASSLNRMTPDKQLLQIVGALEKVRTHADKVRLTEKIFGKGGAALIPMMAQGKAGLIAMQAEAEKLGLVFSRDMAAAVERANDAFGRVKLAIIGLSRQIAIRLAPVMEKMSKWFTDIATQDGRITKMADAFAKAMAEGIARVLDGIQQLVEGLKELRGLIGDITGTKKKVIGWGESVKGAVWDAFSDPWGVRRAKKMAGAGAAATEKPQASLGDRFLSFFNTAIEGFELGPGLEQAQGTMQKLLGRFFGEMADKATGTAQPHLARLGGLLGKMDTFDQQLKAKQREQLLFNMSGGLLGKNYLMKAMQKTPGEMSRGTLAFAQTGSADSYRQQAAIRRQNEPMLKIAKQQLDKLEQVRTEIAKQNEHPNMVANF